MDHIEVYKSGSASAGPNGLAVSGVLNATLPPVVRTAYLEQVRRIAPLALEGRDAELAELAAFCTEAGQGDYAWWRASAWTGKTALLSWFVLHPPPGVRIVSFFITARLADQNDRVAFTDAVLEQLLDLLKRPMPAFLTGATRDAHLLELLRDAAQVCQDEGRRLVLVVDGLDEDRGISGPSGHSIAGLLPARPPAGCRIVVAGRPNPTVFPDVQDGHPLTDRRIVRRLAASPHAVAARIDMRRELDQLLKGGTEDRMLLGLVVAAGGGLSVPDLAELTENTEYDIDERLNTVMGRSFRSRVSRLQLGFGPDLYVLGHEELQKTAVTALGPRRLQRYRRRLHDWADDYRNRGWPPGTPEYLLRGYHRMLVSVGDLPRLVALAADRTRHDRMLDITGGDTAALTEITTIQDMLLTQSDPDLHSMARLAVHRDTLTVRNTYIPERLPAVWAVLGHPTRAEALARSISDPNRRTGALAEVAGALVNAGEHDRALALANQAETTARSISDRDQAAGALARAAGALVEAGEHDRALALANQAETIARSVSNPDLAPDELAAVAEALARAGEHERAVNMAGSISDPHPGWELLQVGVFAAVAEALARAGHDDRASVVAAQAETTACSINDPYLQALALTSAVEALARAGNYGRASVAAAQAETTARSISNSHSQAEVFAALAEALARVGDYDRALAVATEAETTARSIGDQHPQARTLAALAEALARAGDYDRALAVATEAESTARSISDPRVEASVLLDAVEALAQAGEHERAETTARLISDPYQQAWALVKRAGALALAGEREWTLAMIGQTETAAHSITNSYQQARALAQVAGALALVGEYGRADRTARSINDPNEQARALVDVAWALALAGEFDRAETAARSINDPNEQARALVDVAWALALAGEFDRAETAARSINDPNEQARALAKIARTLALAGEYDRALEVATQAEIAARLVTDPFKRTGPLVDVAGARALALALARQYDRAENTARSISYASERAEALAALAGVLAEAGEYERAERTARSISVPNQQARALAEIAMALASVGEHDRASAVATDAESTARSIIDPTEQALALAALAVHASTDVPRNFVMWALREGSWTTPLNVMARIAPDVVTAVADEFAGLVS